ncbi:MAG: carboxymuconolactone decarboxylase family protein [Anaeroplasma bactoclasticum]|nr:carboxymuconolactone decarboxylase family protein [Anaeroplasma bactoclasticum]MCM1557569.1 carboxymuconolactone decarboxylase family protein [Anaeroplasma bactoclasticum]
MKKQTAGRKNLGDLAPKFAELNDDVLFGQVWSREEKLSLRDRSLITVTALMTKGIFDSSLKSHLTNAKNNGVTKEEMIEVITHLAFYAGWPNAWAVFPMLREVYIEETTNNSDSLFGLGEPNATYAKYFKGNSYLKRLNLQGVGIANVTFEPSCRNNWHIHHQGGQILLCTDGNGWYQEWNKPAQKLKPGDVVYIAAEVKHWHGACKNGWFTHISIEVPAEGASNEWLEEVTDEEYNKLN